MEAKVLRAALSAAIRVTVSTTLLGCGGRVSGDVAEAGHGGSNGRPSSDAAAGTAPLTYPYSAGSTANATSSGSSTSGAGSNAELDAAGAAALVGGAGALGGAAGEPASAGGAAAAGAPTAGSSCGGDHVQACFAQIEALQATPGAPLPKAPDVLACCSTLTNAASPGVPDQQCDQELAQRFAPLRFPCCEALGTWEGACAPWGPPVPPELSLEQLRLVEVA
jgi:hypothetical protein